MHKVIAIVLCFVIPALAVDVAYRLSDLTWTGAGLDRVASFGSVANPKDSFPRSASIVGMWHGKHTAGLGALRTNTGAQSNRWEDISGSGYPIVMNGFQMTEADGWNTNGFLYYNGTDGACATGTIAATVGTHSNITIMVVYAKPAAARTGYLWNTTAAGRISLYHDSANMGLYGDISGTFTLFDIEKVSSVWQAQTVTVQGTNTVHHMAEMWYDTTQSTAYGSDARVATPMPTGVFCLGAYDGGQVRFLGNIAFCAIWDVCLTHDEVTNAVTTAKAQLGL